jgi:hypothetical protein
VRLVIQHRRALAWLCIVATLLLGLAAQRHALAHALHAVQAPVHQDALLGHAPACEQCLQFAAVDAAAVASTAVSLPSWAAPAPLGVARLPERAEPFTAYGSRAPPRVG